MKDIIQIAGIHDLTEANLLLAHGVDWLGLPLRLAHHTEDITEEAAARLIRTIPHAGAAVLITYLTDAVEIGAFCRQLGVSKVQLHNEVSVETLRALKSLAPDLFVIKSLVVRGDNAGTLAENVTQFAPHVDGFITDTYDAETGAMGATGKTHDWRISRRLVEISPKPVILAGGLTPDNVAAAIARVKPAGVDAHTGVEGPSGRKDSKLVQAFVMEARQAFARLA